MSDERAELRGVVLDGRYRLGACIGIGGTGVVFEAERLCDGAPTVVKTLRPVYAYNAELSRRLRREAEVARSSLHPGLVPALDEGSLPDGSPYVVMERVWGESLGRLMRREGPLEGPDMAAIAIRTAAVLHSVHRRGYVHRDVKPEHVLLDRSPDGELLVSVLDFGVCAAQTAPGDERDAERGRVYGTPSYVSPEQACGNPDVDGRADVFGLGVVMFEGLAGRLPFTGSSVTSLLRRIIAEDAPRLGLVAPQVHRDLDAVVARALSRDKDQRFPCMRSFARALAPHVGRRIEREREVAARLVVGEAHPDAARTVPDQVAAA